MIFMKAQQVLKLSPQVVAPLDVATQRRQIYVDMQEKAKAAGEGSKVRRYQRMIGQCDTGESRNTPQIVVLGEEDCGAIIVSSFIYKVQTLL